jgi:transcriptional antiterminator
MMFKFQQLQDKNLEDVLMPPEMYEVVKIFNNNVVLAKHMGIEKIIINKGLGFSKKQGDIIPADIELEKIFAIESKETRQKFKQLITMVDDNLIGICEEIFSMIDSEFEESLNEEIHVRLIDHIAFTVHRLEQNDKIDNPFIIEIETLYKKEMEVARKAVAILEKRLGISIPEGETGFITLHIHSAINRGKLSNTIKYAYICNSAIEIIEDELNVEINRQSIDYARFVTHIRFSIERVLSNIPVKNELLKSIKRTYKDSYKIAKKVAGLIEDQMNARIPDEEIGYLTMHIERFRSIL